MLVVSKTLVLKRIKHLTHFHLSQFASSKSLLQSVSQYFFRVTVWLINSHLWNENLAEMSILAFLSQYLI